MNTSHILNLLLAAAIVILSVKVTFLNGNRSASGEKKSGIDAIETIMTRVSVRAYTDRAVEDDKIETMLRAAMAAPSAGNKQPWRFVVIRDKAILGAIASNLPTMTMTDKAPVAIVVCGDMNDTFPGDGLDYWVEDASAATENLLLSAHAMGLGAVWCGIYPMKERVTFIQRLLELPDNIVPLNVVPIGYPAEEPAVKDKWKPSSIHYDTWTDTAADAVIPESKAKEWQKVDPVELRINPFTLFTDAMALTVGTKDKMNSMTIGWGGLGVLWGKERPVVTVYVEKRRYTHQFMEDNDYFTVEAFDKDYDKALQYLGTVSGRDEDKIKGSGLTLKMTDLGTPAFEEGNLILECRKIYGAPFNPDGFGDVPKEVYSDRPLHSIYIGEIVNAYIKR